jgi:hypothetical protein
MVSICFNLMDGTRQVEPVGRGAWKVLVKDNVDYGNDTMEHDGKQTRWCSGI